MFYILSRLDLLNRLDLVNKRHLRTTVTKSLNKWRIENPPKIRWISYSKTMAKFEGPPISSSIYILFLKSATTFVCLRENIPRFARRTLLSFVSMVPKRQQQEHCSEKMIQKTFWNIIVQRRQNWLYLHRKR